MKKILIIGGTGSLGNELTQRYLDKYIIYIYSRDENKQWIMKQKFRNYKNLHFIIGDIADEKRVIHTLHKYRPEYIIIAAAMKHVDICEYNTYECVKTNVIGIQNCVNCIATSQIPQIESVLFISTDKACSPVNVYGLCKGLSERIVIEKSMEMERPRFSVVRYGNVLNSRGSLLPKFHSIGQDPELKTFCVTHKDMTRFFMTLNESVKLINYALFRGVSGRIYIPVIKSFYIAEIASYFSKKYNKPVEFTGIRPGEKMHETLINDMEIRRTIKEGDIYAICPFYEKVQGVMIDLSEYSSNVAIVSDPEIIANMCEKI